LCRVVLITGERMLIGHQTAKEAPGLRGQSPWWPPPPATSASPAGHR
jgi:hypothetical protein